MAKGKPKTTKIYRLGSGAIFAIERGDHVENWKIIGRPGKSGRVDGKDAYTVKAIFVPVKDSDYSPDKEAKYFDVNFDVYEVRKAVKDFAAIDQRDQPEGVTSIEDLIKEQREVDEVEEEPSSIEEMIDTEEDEKTEEEPEEEPQKRGRPRKVN